MYTQSKANQKPPPHVLLALEVDTTLATSSHAVPVHPILPSLTPAADAKHGAVRPEHIPSPLTHLSSLENRLPMRTCPFAMP